MPTSPNSEQRFHPLVSTYSAPTPLLIQRFYFVKSMARISIGSGIVGAALLSGCASTGFIPASLQSQIDRNLTFSHLQASPESYQGRIVLLGGEVLMAKVKAWPLDLSADWFYFFINISVVDAWSYRVPVFSRLLG